MCFLVIYNSFSSTVPLSQECLLGLLHSKTVIYVTHQIEFLPAADLILVSLYDFLIQCSLCSMSFISDQLYSDAGKGGCNECILGEVVQRWERVGGWNY